MTAGNVDSPMTAGDPVPAGDDAASSGALCQGRKPLAPSRHGARNDIVLMPTGTCFDDAFTYLDKMAREESVAVRRGDYLLCHGICTMQSTWRSGVLEPGKPYAHAWVERGDAVIMFGYCNGNYAAATVSKDEFYVEVHVKQVMRYTPKQALHLAKLYLKLWALGAVL